MHSGVQRGGGPTSFNGLLTSGSAVKKPINWACWGGSYRGPDERGGGDEVS